MKLKKQNKTVKICLIKLKGGIFLSVIKINPDQINELYDTLFEERGSADVLLNSLILFKNTLEDQGFENSSLSQVHYYVDTLINLMEVLSGNMIALQENASEIASEFSVAISDARSEEHTSELQSRFELVCRLLLEKKNSWIEICYATHLLYC